MNHEQKAKELIDKFLSIIDHQDHYWGAEKEAIGCAIVAVDEILETISYFAYSNTTWDDFETGKMSFWGNDNSPELYWMKVKEELVNQLDK